MRFLSDGSRNPASLDKDFDMLGPPDRYGDPPMLTIISTNTWPPNTRPAQFLDYGPYATLGTDPPRVAPQMLPHLEFVYGDEVGLAYSASIKEFTKDVDDQYLQEYVDKLLDDITLKSTAISRKVAEVCTAKQEPNDSDIATIIDTPMGKVNINEEIKRARKAPELRKELAELELHRHQKVDIDVLRGAGGISTLSPGITVQTLEENAKLLAELSDRSLSIPTGERQKKLGKFLVVLDVFM
jgi:hypothetical protein